MKWSRTVTNGLPRYRSGRFCIYAGWHVTAGGLSVRRHWYVRCCERPIGADRYDRLKDAKAAVELYAREENRHG